MSAKKIILFFIVLVQVAIVAITAAFVATEQGTDIFIYLEIGFVALAVLGIIVWCICSSFGSLFFALGSFVHIALTLIVIAATGYYAVMTDDIMFIIFLGACSLVMIVSILPILCAKK